MNYEAHARRVKKLYGVTKFGIRMYRMYLGKYDASAWFLSSETIKDLRDV